MLRDLVVILSEAGAEGLPLKKIVKHVYNLENSLFNPLNYDDIQKKVTAYLRRRSLRASDMFLKPCRGRYSLNFNNARIKVILADIDNEGNDADGGNGFKDYSDWPMLDLF